MNTIAVWKQPREQPFTTYRDPKTGRWITVKSPQVIEDKIVEAQLYRDAQTGEWITVKPMVRSEDTASTNSLE